MADSAISALAQPANPAPAAAPTPGLVSVIIPCYGQAHYLGEAIESVLAQTYPRIEIIVIDDGSPDDTSEVAARYPGVRCIRQQNQGLSAARNAGINASRGSYLAFLDADDRLVPAGIQAGIECLDAHPACAFAWGHHRYIRADGSVRSQHSQPGMGDDAYCALLEVNLIGMCATVLYRREIFEEVGGFRTDLRSCEDHELYLRIARGHVIARHDRLVAEYRWHDANMTNNATRMLRSALQVYDLQDPWIARDPVCLGACRTGIRFARRYFAGRLLQDLRQNLLARRLRAVVSGLAQLARFVPAWLAAVRRERRIGATRTRPITP